MTINSCADMFLLKFLILLYHISRKNSDTRKCGNYSEPTGRSNIWIFSYQSLNFKVASSCIELISDYLSSIEGKGHNLLLAVNPGYANNSRPP